MCSICDIRGVVQTEMIRRLRCSDQIDMMIGGDARKIDKVMERVPHLSGIRTNRDDDMERLCMTHCKNNGLDVLYKRYGVWCKQE